MAKPLRVQAGELTADEIMTALKDGQRVIIEVEVLGATREVALRERDGVFYCDTPTTLHKHDDEDGMVACIVGQGYTSDGA